MNKELVARNEAITALRIVTGHFATIGPNYDADHDSGPWSLPQYDGQRLLDALTALTNAVVILSGAVE